MTEYSPPDADAVNFTLESYTPPSADSIDFTLAEEDPEPEPEPEPTPDEGPDIPVGFDLPGDISLPMELDFQRMETGVSMFLVGSMSLLLGAAWFLKNWAAGMMWSFAFIVLIFAGLFGMGLEIFWLAVVGTLVLLFAGMIVRWIA